MISRRENFLTQNKRLLKPSQAAYLRERKKEWNHSLMAQHLFTMSARASRQLVSPDLYKPSQSFPPLFHSKSYRAVCARAQSQVMYSFGHF